MLTRQTETFTVLTSYNAAPHNRYQPHPAEPDQYTKCSTTVFVLLKVGIMMPETCWRVEQKPSKCSRPTTQRPTTATNHIQQNQNITPNAITGALFSWRCAYWCPKHVETEVNNKHLIVASCWFFCLHTLLTMHGHRNLKPVPVSSDCNNLHDFVPYAVTYIRKFIGILHDASVRQDFESYKIVMNLPAFFHHIGRLYGTKWNLAVEGIVDKTRNFSLYRPSLFGALKYTRCLTLSLHPLIHTHYNGLGI